MSHEGVTRTLAEFVVSTDGRGIPQSARTEARRTFLNWVGCAVGGAGHPTVDIALEALGPFSGPPEARVLGRRDRLDIMHAALMNGISSHVLDFDDTHLRTVIHPAAPVASAITALADRQPVSGADFITALVLGVEVECRIGNAVYPPHYRAGWHITGTTGVFGAAAAAGKLMNLSPQQMVWALGLAATQPVGLQEMFGTMTKAFHPGRAAQNGLTAALLAARNYTSSNAALEAVYGWANLLSTACDYTAITGGLGGSFEIESNTYKPYPCGIVIHPVIDGCIQLHREHHLAAGDIAGVALRVHPLVLQLTGKKSPATGLETKFSVYHAASVALVEGAAGVAQFSDEAAADPRIVALRGRVTAEADTAIHEDGAVIVVSTVDGRRLEKVIVHCIGSLERPMSNTELAAKFKGLTAGVLPPERTEALIKACLEIETLGDVSVISKLSVP